MIEARPIDFYTLSPIINLKVRANQEHLVAPNSITIAQFHYEPAGWVRGLWDGDTPVGLIAMINPLIESPSFEEGDRTDAAYLWRLMIADDHQAKGFGGEAISIAFAQTRKWGLPYLQTSVVPGENCPAPFYEKHGLMQTGAVIDKELELLSSIVS